MKTTPSDDFKNFSGSELNLLRTHMATMKHHLRIKLLRSLLNQKLATRDIFYFTKSQADRRTFKKTQDWATTVTAMTIIMVTKVITMRITPQHRRPEIISTS